MKKALITLLLFVSLAIAAEYTGSTIPDKGDTERDLLVKINKVLNDAKTATAPVAISFKGAPSFAVTRYTATGSATIGLAARATRRGFSVRNNGASVVYIGNIGVTQSVGYALNAGEAIGLDTTAVVYVLTGGGSVAVTFLETYD